MLNKVQNNIFVFELDCLTFDICFPHPNVCISSGSVVGKSQIITYHPSSTRQWHSQSNR